jgi:hypothetical protein
MRFYLVLAAVAALTASVSAADADTEGCPVFCHKDSQCGIQNCGPDRVCVSMSSLDLIK